MKNALLCLALASLAGCNCGDRLVSSGGGTLRVTLINADPKTSLLEVVARHTATEERKVSEPVDALPKVLDIEGLTPATYMVRVVARDATQKQLQSVWVTDVEVLVKKVTEIIIDLSQSVPGPTEICDGIDNDGDGQTDEGVDLAVCAECTDGIEALLGDDPRCGAIRCNGLDHTDLRGDNTAAGSSTCVRIAYADLTASRCEAIGRCATANGPKCTTSTESVLATAGLCQTITGCGSGSPSVATSPDGTPCGSSRVCLGGACVTPTDGGTDAGVDPIGCSDGTREGFQSLTSYPGIAGCSGAWTLPGVTRANLVPTCNRGSGNSSGNTEGTGCSAADLCSAGWHVCAGKDEVAQEAPAGCADAVPAGTLDKMLFFAVSQASQNGSICDTTGDNDVFGCGNLGTQLVPAKNCGVLTRALASTQPNSCGYNEAEPSLGPWQCIGGAGSDLHEGATVTKKGCPNTSCSYSGSPVGNSDKGGVLCCRD